MDSVLCPQGNINSKLIVILDFVGLFVSNYAMRSSEVGHIDLSPQSIIRAVYFGTNHDFCGILEASYSHRTTAGPSAQGRAVVVADRRMGTLIPGKLPRDAQ